MGSEGGYQWRSGGPAQAQPAGKGDLGWERSLPQGRGKDSKAAWDKYIQSVSERPEGALADLTPSQRRYVEQIQAIERANPKAKPSDIAMAISLLLWGGRLWEKDGTAADVATPGGLPLVLDYAGGEGYRDVKLSPEQKTFIRKQREVHDRQGRESGVAHTFPAVAAQAGREGTLAGAYNTYMVTSGGDAIQDVARVIVEQSSNVFREAEARDNERAIQIAEEIGDSGQPLSVALIEHFRAENGGGPQS